MKRAQYNCRHVMKIIICLPAFVLWSMNVSAMSNRSQLVIESSWQERSPQLFDPHQGTSKSEL